MNELIKINYDNDRPTVLGKDLHKALEVKEKYADWFKRMCEYGFVENVDYMIFPKSRKNLSKSADLTSTTNSQLKWQRKSV